MEKNDLEWMTENIGYQGLREKAQSIEKVIKMIETKDKQLNKDTLVKFLKELSTNLCQEGTCLNEYALNIADELGDLS